MSQEITALLHKVAEMVVQFFVQYSFQVFGGIIILFVGSKIAAWLACLLTNLCQKKNLDPTLTKFAAGIVRTVVLLFAVLMALEKFGVTITPIVAAATALLFGGSFAIQGTLSNFVAGLSIIFTKPFVVGDTVAVAGVHGVVDEVKLGVTVLMTEDGEKILVPNKKIVGEIIWNSKQKKVVETAVGISYGDSPQDAIRVIRGILEQFPEISAAPAPHVGIQEFGDSSINIGMRYWVPTKSYFQIFYKVNLAVYDAFKKEGISIPFPQRDVRIISKN